MTELAAIQGIYYVTLKTNVILFQAKPKQRVCEVGKPFGYGACQSTDPPCQKGYECVEDVCCKRGKTLFL